MRLQQRPTHKHALIEAQGCVAMGSGTDVARQSADVVLFGPDLLRFAETLSIARRTRGIGDAWSETGHVRSVPALKLSPISWRWSL
jgi:hypothetical protein